MTARWWNRILLIPGQLLLTFEEWKALAMNQEERRMDSHNRWLMDRSIYKKPDKKGDLIALLE